MEQVESNETVNAKRNVKLTAKALACKVENLQKERKTHVNKMKGLIPDIKELMKRKENVQEVKVQLQTLTQLLDTAVNLHQTIIPLLPEDEKTKQNDWFSSIERYSRRFKNDVAWWLDENEHVPNTVDKDEASATTHVCVTQTNDAQHAAAQDTSPVTPSQVLQDDVNPSDSISNVQSKQSAKSVASGKSSGSGKRSNISGTSSARIKAEADLAALMVRQKLLQDKHALEEEEQQLRKRKERLKLDEEIAAHLAKVSVLRAASVSGSKSTATERSNAMNSYFKEQEEKTKFNVNATPFIPLKLETSKPQPKLMDGGPATRPRSDGLAHAARLQPPILKPRLPDPNPLPNAHNDHEHHGIHLNAGDSASCGEQNNVFDIMKRQNEITTLLVQQQQHAFLPKRDIQLFDGDPLQFHTFMRAFENCIESKSNSHSDCLYFLEQFTRGRPRDLVRSCQHMDPHRGYAQAKQLLQEHFGDEQRVAAAYMDKALSWATIKSEDVKALQDYSLFLRGCSNAMNEVQYMFDMDMPANMLTIIKKLPYKLRDRWRTTACEIQETRNQRATFSDIVYFIERQVRILTDPVFGDIQDASPAVSRSMNRTSLKPRSRPKGSSFATTVTTVQHNNTTTKGRRPDTTSSAKKVCLFCEGGHTLEFCSQMEKRAHTEKITFLREKGMCFGCLCIGHVSKDCRKRLSCKVCSLKHPTVLHIHSKHKEPMTEEEPGAAVGCALVSNGLTGAGGDECKLPIVPVWVKSKKSNHAVATYAFLDQGSTAVFCTVNLMNKLNLSGKRTRILLRTMGQEEVVNSNVVTGLEVAGLDGEMYCDLPNTYTQEYMPVHKGNIPHQKDLKRWAYLRDVHLPDIDSEVELLIGTNVPRALEPLQVIRSVDNGPYAIKTILGWTVNGPLGGDSGNGMDVATVNRISVLNLEDLWQQQFRTDFPECVHDEQPGQSIEDQKFMRLVQDSAKLVDGHYQIALPLRSSVAMPNNRKVAEQRIVNLKRRFKKDSSFHQQYTDFMNDMVTKGYAEQVPSDELARTDGRLWYIPHHGVYHPQKEKIRVVFDCAATFQSTSLNAQLLQGPDLTSSLIGVLARFRKEPVVIMADIESMFHQVKVPKEDTDLLRFLWWPNGDCTQDLVDFRMLVHLFGAASSPSCANFALRKCAKDNEGQFCQETIERILHCFYVDDCLVSTASEEEAVALYHDLVSVCAKGGFKLTKWISNSRAVMAAIPEDQRAKGMKDLDLDHDLLPVERVLGVQWCLQSDAFKFKILVQDRPLTRRGILSVVSSVYDPLGILSPIVLSAKIILQELCRQRLGWDDSIPPSAAQEWRNWLKELHQLEHFQVSRCLKPQDFGDVTVAQLHHFTDASENGYGVVTYLVLQNACSQRHSSFVMGKSRVAPLQSISIPRMELTAATMASRLDTFWKKELRMSLTESMFWTDSTSVLKYIKNETSRFRTFVANRVSEILKVSDPSQWKYVNTLSNPADVASRGLKVDMFLRNEAWLAGPAYLLQPEQDWPVSPDCSGDLLPNDPEVKASVAVNVVQVSEDVDATTQLIHHFSSWTSLRRAVAWFIRLKGMLRALSQKRTGTNSASTQSVSGEHQGPSSEHGKGGVKDLTPRGFLTVDELLAAEKEIVRFCQRKRFPDELLSLKNGESVKRRSHIFKLAPVLEDGILRVGGRLSRAALPEHTKHPAILTKELHISDVLLRHIHQQVGHGGRNYMLSKLREKYWIPGVSTAIRRILSKCVVCRRLQAAPGCQLMADLPADRVCPDEPPFTKVGVDYFGPFEVKSRRSIVKRYGVMFTCLAIRAVHIEVAPSLDTDAFINALRRFMARRGQVQEIRSDNGTNFVGGERELREAIRGWNQAQINDVLLQREVKWIFNPPAGSHHGGAWERLIRSVRKVLNSVLKVQNLDEEGLHTVLCEVEAVINGRPITKASTDPNDLEPLTPNHLLLLKTSPSLPPGQFQRNDIYSRRRWRQVQYMSDLFWKRWTKEYLPQLQERQKWTGIKRNFVEGDVVLIVDETAPRNSWVMGKVIQTFPDRRGFVRRLRIKTRTSSLERPITKVCLLQEAEA